MATCGYCRTYVTNTDSRTKACPFCHARLHPDCAKESEGCTTYACENRPQKDYNPQFVHPKSLNELTETLYIEEEQPRRKLLACAVAILIASLGGMFWMISSMDPPKRERRQHYDIGYDPQMYSSPRTRTLFSRRRTFSS